MKNPFYITGVDEVGRGALAGPVVACAFSLPLYSKDYPRNAKFLENLTKLEDSKLLNAKERETFYAFLKNSSCLDFGLGIVSNRVIDKINIYEATFLAMKKALLNLKYLSPRVFIDGPQIIKTLPASLKPLKQIPVIKGDRFHVSIMAASVIAKVTRDRLITRLGKKYPQYDFSQHKGYGTKLHYAKIKEFGPSPFHRKSFNLTNW
jgi:ribonuclease HII